MKEVYIYTFDNKNYVLLDRIENYLFLSNEKNDHDMMIRKIENEDEETLLPLESDEEFEKALLLLVTKKLKEEEIGSMSNSVGETKTYDK